MTANVNFTSISPSNVGLSSNVDVSKSIKSFWDEMAVMLKDYAELTMNPNPDRTFQVGNLQVPGDQVTSPAVAMIMQDRLAKIELAQSALLDIYNKLFTLEKTLNSTLGG